MKLKDLTQPIKNPERVCEYLTSKNIKFKKLPLSNGNGADFDLIDSDSTQVEQIVNTILKIPTITNNFDVSYLDNTTISVRRK